MSPVAENDRENTGSQGKDVEASLARHGDLSNLEIPAVDAEQSAAFYGQVLGWSLQRRGAGDSQFEDGSRHLIGQQRQRPDTQL